MFKRLVRFVSADNKTYFGEAIMGRATDARFAKEAHVIVGDIFGSFTITDIVKPIKHLLSPLDVTQVGTVRCIGMNYAKHADECGGPRPKYPVIFHKPRTAVTDPEAPIVVPQFAQIPDDADSDVQVDYETELVIVIGTGGKDISVANAKHHILGYCVGNDVSQRTWQIKRGGSQFTTGKMCDTFAPIGPCIVNKDLVEDVDNLGIRSRVNGEIRQDSNTNDMIFPVAEIVSFVSQGSTLMPGDLIFTGTPSGVAMGMTGEKKWLKNGDVVVCELDGVGSIENRVFFENSKF